MQQAELVVKVVLRSGEVPDFFARMSKFAQELGTTVVPHSVELKLTNVGGYPEVEAEDKARQQPIVLLSDFNEEERVRLGKKLQEWREAHDDATQVSVAKILECSPATVSLLESGGRAPSVKLLRKIAGLLETTVPELLAELGYYNIMTAPRTQEPSAE